MYLQWHVRFKITLWLRIQQIKYVKCKRYQLWQPLFPIRAKDARSQFYRGLWSHILCDFAVRGTCLYYLSSEPSSILILNTKYFAPFEYIQNSPGRQTSCNLKEYWDLFCSEIDHDYWRKLPSTNAHTINIRPTN